MSTTKLPQPESIPTPPDIALIERLANELFAGAALSGSAPSTGFFMPPRTADLAIPLTGADPLDLHLDEPRTQVPHAPLSHAWAPGADLVLPDLDSGYPNDAVLRDLLKDRKS